MATLRYGRRRDRGLLAGLSRLLDEIRNPTTSQGRVLVISLAALALILLALLAASGLFLSRVLKPVRAAETTTTDTFFGTAETLEFVGPGGRSHSAWFFPGLRGAPVIVLCHGYRSSRSEVMTLATSFQMHRYNVLVFNFAGHGESPADYTMLGPRESAELLAALEMLRQRKDVDANRVGLWGYSLGAYAALSAAPDYPGVKAMVVDSAYERPADLLRLELNRLGADLIPLASQVAVLEFHLVSLFQASRPSPRQALGQLGGVQKLFIVSQDAGPLGGYTRELAEVAPPPKEVAQLARTNLPSLSEEERRAYENLVIRFFLKHLPVTPAR
ncbi:MAG TPA: alpha/beta fold hydrolase [Candidatus Xenobia bacterium]|nr:alpha/beta fold hydrolase [Candidatus Xenobia bacterium]